MATRHSREEASGPRQGGWAVAYKGTGWSSQACAFSQTWGRLEKTLIDGKLQGDQSWSCKSRTFLRGEGESFI